ncbi:MAG: response regulator [Tsuneonella suprasediminis]|uniref:Response regulator n=1 Tax=Tsuneonella suprasediminis TaxID=2306996 RepID=A0A419R679_9SPHN|nr:response regulator [Tsuneonella suprasediminis]RJX71180.1 response regulator [Tsuneonella suprasediminis]UBS34420.1 response regulator [Altererythrobacter sp. N1]
MNQPCVLVAEDELIIGMDLCNTVAEAGFVVEGPFDTAQSARQAIAEHRPDIAILDVRLEDGESYALAEALIAEDVPVIFHSGQVSPEEVAARFPEVKACSKPCPPDQIISMMREALEPLHA